MEMTQDELKAHLMATDATYRKLADEHATYHRQLEEIEAKDHLTLADEEEEHRIKKLKLHCKDLMLNMLSRHQTQQVA